MYFILIFILSYLVYFNKSQASNFFYTTHPEYIVFGKVIT